MCKAQSNRTHGNPFVIVLVSGESPEESVIDFDDNENTVKWGIWSAPDFTSFATELILSIQVPLNMGKWIVKSC